MAAKPIPVVCPDCGARLEVDPVSGTVLSHGEGRAGGGKPKDLGDALRGAGASGQDAEDRFNAAMDAEKKHRGSLEDKFRSALDKASKDDAEKPPDRPLDDRWR